MFDGLVNDELNFKKLIDERKELMIKQKEFPPVIFNVNLLKYGKFSNLDVKK
jgi:hypothetical protein